MAVRAEKKTRKKEGKRFENGGDERSGPELLRCNVQQSGAI